MPTTLPPIGSLRRRLHPSAGPDSLTRVRLRVWFPQPNQQDWVISQLSQQGLSATIRRTVLTQYQPSNSVDLELTGTVAQLQVGLAYLASLNLVIQGKPNPDGDGWYC